MPAANVIKILFFFPYSTKGTYVDGEKKDKFTFTLALVFVQCIINALFSKLGKVKYLMYVCVFEG